MSEIVPAILEKDFSEIKNKLTFLRGRTKCVQLDFCDGIYEKNQTWPFASGGYNDDDFLNILDEKEGLPFWEEIDFEFDLMIMDAVENFHVYMKLGPKRIIFHLGAQKNLSEFEEFLDSLDMYIRDSVEIGIAFKPSDDLGIVSRLSHKVDFLQCMGIDEVGFQGHQFDPKAIENIKFLKQNLHGIILSVDGGINLENAPTIINAGADRLTVGSGIWRDRDPISALENFQSLTNIL